MTSITRRPTIRLALVFTLTALASCAQGREIEKVNPTRVGFEAGLSFDDTDLTSGGDKVGNAETTTLVLNTVVGHRLEDGMFEPGLLLAYERADTEATDFTTGARSDLTTDTLRVGINLRVWVLESGNVRPWVEAAGGGLFVSAESDGASEDATGYFVRGGVGVSSFITESVSLDGALRVTGQSVSIDDVDLDVDSTAIDAFVGISTYF